MGLFVIQPYFIIYTAFKKFSSWSFNRVLTGTLLYITIKKWCWINPNKMYNPGERKNAILAVVFKPVGLKSPLNANLVQYLRLLYATWLTLLIKDFRL